MNSREVEIEKIVNQIEHPKTKEYCASCLKVFSHEQNFLNLNFIVERLKQINTGKSVLLADYLESLDNLTAGNSVKDKFLELAMIWNQETWHSSRTRIEHPAYQKIISLGEPVIPFLLEGLEKGTGRWFHALSEITGEDPVMIEHRGWTVKMVQAWLEWGEQKGYQISETISRKSEP